MLSCSVPRATVKRCRPCARAAPRSPTGQRPPHSPLASHHQRRPAPQR